MIMITEPIRRHVRSSGLHNQYGNHAMRLSALFDVSAVGYTPNPTLIEYVDPV